MVIPMDSVIEMELGLYNFSFDFCSGCTVVSMIVTFLTLFALHLQKSRYPNITYRACLYAYVISNVVDSSVYWVTYVNAFVWRNSFVLFSDGFIFGPRAIGFYMIFSSLPACILGTLNILCYALVNNFSKLEFLSSQCSFICFSFWISINALFHYAIPTILFQADGDSIDQVADFFFTTLDKGRDFGFEHCIGTYWVYDTFDTAKWKPIVGLTALYLSFLTALAFNFFTSHRILRVLRFRHQNGHNSHTHHNLVGRHLTMMWIQLSLSAVMISIPRLIMAITPLLHYVYRGEFIWLTYGTVFLVSLKPIIANVAFLVMIKDLRKNVGRILWNRKRRMNSAASATVELY